MQAIGIEGKWVQESMEGRGGLIRGTLAGKRMDRRFPGENQNFLELEMTPQS